MARDFHEKPFDSNTETKLEFFREYLVRWLPVWLTRCEHGEEVIIADYFAGPGRDSTGTSGSPIRILEVVREYAAQIASSGVRVRVVLNEKSKSKFDHLSKVIDQEAVPRELCEIELRNRSFSDALSSDFPRLRSSPCLLIIDQQGVIELSDDVFGQILRLGATDFIAFLSSSTLRRFGREQFLQDRISLPAGEMSASQFNDTHRTVARHYRDLARRSGERVFIGKFSIKKGSNVYGLLFGAGHPRGLEKFVEVCWKEDTIRGEANFDIDSDRIDPAEPHLFTEFDHPTKLTSFKQDLRTAILQHELRTDAEVYVFTLEEGFLPKHGREVLQSLIRERAVRMADGARHRVSKNGYADPRRVEVL